MEKIRSTTILGVIRDGKAAIAGDGQVTLGNTVMKHKTVKVRKLYNNTILTGFAGASADAFTLFDKFEDKLKEYKGNLTRAAVELTKEWRRDKFLQKLEALMVVMDGEKGYLLSGSGDVIDADDNLFAIGSGGPYALAAARALNQNTDMTAAEIAEKALKISAGICIYTNENITVLELDK
ncbi:MAG: ATP-dependent protease subunit HslV [Candidatus Marinimicrobia bacterium]|nr:ATP-dependent protease subunit HslV [Candidatus Neomarinimicrobiota bacterium]